MSKRDWFTEHAAQARNDWFKNHVAKLLAENETTARVHEWRNPASWNYGMRFILHRRWLVILGDIGESTYEWSEDITPEFLRGLDFGYFRSKCQASEYGKRYDILDTDAGRDALMAEWKEQDKPSKWAAVLYELASKIGECSCIDEWHEIISDYHQSGDIDSDEACIARGLALFPHPRQIGHFVGVQMALEQLAKGGVA